MFNRRHLMAAAALAAMRLDDGQVLVRTSNAPTYELTLP